MRAFFSGIVPKWIGSAPYHLALQTFILGARSAGAKVWPRNSFISQAFNPLISDLDLTIWFDATPQLQQVSEVVGLHKRLKSVFPLLGEMNLYDGTEAESL